MLKQFFIFLIINFWPIIASVIGWQFYKKKFDNNNRKLFEMMFFWPSITYKYGIMPPKKYDHSN